MATKAQVRKALAAIGASWDESWDTLDSPAGMAWNASSCHSIADVYVPDERAADRYAGLLEQIRQGVTPCVDADCEMC